ncbi:hypothetical protein LC593_32790 [Nostoc sp. CHAB 5844]|nr:hypothetical protein [Nostoc sp. CHAB 5844]
MALIPKLRSPIVIRKVWRSDRILARTYAHSTNSWRFGGTLREAAARLR